jgi:hypothetical protein
MSIPNKHSVIEGADTQRDKRELDRSIAYAANIGAQAIINLDKAFRDIRGEDGDMSQAFARAIGKGITHQGINTSGMLSALKSELATYRRKVRE